MTEQHPITPTEKAVRGWLNLPLSTEELLVIAYRAGADQELEACVEWLKKYTSDHAAIEFLYEARRPKPPIKADQALAVLNTAQKAGTPTVILDIDQFDTILLALKRMKELEKPNE